MLKKQDITQHPCFLERMGPGQQLSHRSGGFGNTCERCGTKIEGSNNNPIVSDEISWVPVERPKPYEPGSLNRAIYELTHSTATTDKIIKLIE